MEKMEKVIPNRHYELMLIYTPVLAEDEFKTARKKYTDMIKEKGGKIEHEKVWGLKSLAYPIEKKTTGLYHIVEYTAPSDLFKSLEIQLNRDDTVMRHMVTVLDKYAVAYNERKRTNAHAAEPAKQNEEA